MQNAQAYRQAELGYRQQQLQSLDAYRQAALGQRSQYQDMENQIRLLQAQAALGRDPRGPYVSTPNGPLNTQTGVYGTGMPPAAQSGGAGTGSQTNNQIQSLPSQAATQNPAMMRANTASEQADDRNFLGLVNAFGAANATTNNPSSFLTNLISNRMVNTYGPNGLRLPVQQSLAPTNSFQLTQPQGFDTNAILQQAQSAIQQGANPQAVRARLQQNYGLTLQ